MFKLATKRKSCAKGFKGFFQRPIPIVMGLLLAFLLLLTGRIVLLRLTQPSYSAFMRADPANPKPIVFVPLEQISPHLIRAVLVSEDNLFFSHSGFDWASLKKAYAGNVKKQKVTAGGSTITQQLAKNLFLSRDKTWLRKINEAGLTVLIETFLPKERILELYLNYAEMGPGIYGVDQASAYHFHVRPDDLSQTQASLLAATLINGKIYGKKPYPARTRGRQKKILYRMQHYALAMPSDLLKHPLSNSKSDDKTVQTLIQDVTAAEAEKPDADFEEDFPTETAPNTMPPLDTADSESPQIFLDED